MEQQKAAAKPKSKIMKFLPKATSSVSFQNPPLYSPNKDKRSSEKPHKSNLGKGFSGPLVSIIPSGNRRKIKNDSTYSLVVYEPTSPRVSCMGQVKCQKHQNKLSKVTKVPKTTSFKDDKEKAKKDDPVSLKSKKKLGFGRIFHGGEKKCNSKRDLNIPKAPCLSTMKRFSSGRDAFTNFDWTTQVTPLESAHGNYFTDDGEEIMMPSSAPVMVRNKGVCDDFVRVVGVNLEPKKEINLWKRRTMAQPQPLQLHAAN